MKQLAEFLPIIIFFVIYQMDGSTINLFTWSHTVDGIYSATKALIVATLFILPLQWWLTGYIEKRLLWTSAAVFVFGGATLFFRNELFIQWKPTVFNWGLALVFLASQFFGEKNLLQRLMGQQLTLPQRIWGYLNALWIANFTLVGTLNIVVAYRFEEAFWVSYKLYSSVGFTLLLMLLTMFLVLPYLKEQDAGDGDDAGSMRGSS